MASSPESPLVTPNQTRVLWLAAYFMTHVVCSAHDSYLSDKCSVLLPPFEFTYQRKSGHLPRRSDACELIMRPEPAAAIHDCSSYNRSLRVIGLFRETLDTPYHI